jgi:hypothetical protein
MAFVTSPLDISKHILLDGGIGVLTGLFIDFAANDVWETLGQPTGDPLMHNLKLLLVIGAQLFFNVTIGYWVSNALYAFAPTTDPTNGVLMLLLMFHASQGLKNRLTMVGVIVKAQISKLIHQLTARDDDSMEPEKTAET